MYIEVTFTKPLHDNFLFLRDKYIKQAKREKKLLKIITPAGIHYTTPKDWLKGAKYLEQEFRIPGVPLRMWGNYATPNKEPQQPAPQDISMPADVMMRLGKIFKERYAKNTQADKTV